MSLSDLLSITFSLSGLGLILVAVFSAIGTMVASARLKTWEARQPQGTFVGFAWQELGRSLILGFVVALGCTPLSVFVLSDLDSFWSNMYWLSGIWWMTSALIFFYGFILAGFVGYLTHQSRTQTSVTQTAIWFELMIVFAASVPFLYIFVYKLIPTLWPVLTALGRTWQLYVAIYFS